MKVSLSWLRELVELKVSLDELVVLIPLRTVGLKEVTADFIELDMKGYNRADLLSMRGVAREVVAITGSKLKLDEIENIYNKFVLLQKNVKKTEVKIEDEKLSPVQCSAKIEGLKVGPSSPDWVKKLEDCGIRSVNNLVDVTNLIMLEYGQPLHAFDAQTVKGETINVRCAKKDEQLITLDGKLRKLSTQDIVLADTDKPLDVAGIMGSKDTEVKQSTHAILLSASMFNPVMVRKTAQRIGLHSEASKRFLHGLTRTNLLKAYSAAITMYESLGGKLTAINLVGDFDEKPKTVTLTLEKINSLLGVDVSSEQIESNLKKLGLHPKGVNGGWEVAVPYWRLDIKQEEDLVEEVARMYGYEKIDGKPLVGNKPKPLDEFLQNFIHNLKVKLKEAGLTEVQTYSFYSTDVLNNFEMNRDELIRVANPISSETEYLRNWISPNLLEVVAKNIKKGFKDIAIFEVGKVYLKKKSSLPDEKYYLAIALMNGSDNPIEELLVILNAVKDLSRMRVPNKLRDSSPSAQNDIERTLFHPKRFADLESNGKPIGKIAELHPRIVNKFGIEKRVAVLEIDIQPIVDLHNKLFYTI